jgi:hypothetical protein
MELPVELNKCRQSASVIFAGQNDFGFLAEWREKLGDDKNPVRRDAVDFAHLALDRFSTHSAIESYAKSIGDIEDHIANNPKCEVASLVLLKCDWFPDSSVIGLSHFRRTWSNNIILDYLAVHPFIPRPPEGYPHVVRGVGTALLYFLSHVAKKYACGAIWGEATPMSSGFYKSVFSLDSVEDLIYAPRSKFVEFADQLELKWAGKT